METQLGFGALGAIPVIVGSMPRRSEPRRSVGTEKQVTRFRWEHEYELGVSPGEQIVGTRRKAKWMALEDWIEHSLKIHFPRIFARGDDVRLTGYSCEVASTWEQWHNFRIRSGADWYEVTSEPHFENLPRVVSPTRKDRSYLVYQVFEIDDVSAHDTDFPLIGRQLLKAGMVAQTRAIEATAGHQDVGLITKMRDLLRSLGRNRRSLTEASPLPRSYGMLRPVEFPTLDQAQAYAARLMRHGLVEINNEPLPQFEGLVAVYVASQSTTGISRRSCSKRANVMEQVSRPLSEEVTPTEVTSTIDTGRGSGAHLTVIQGGLETTGPNLGGGPPNLGR